MVGQSKILTVSYGTFSCTLEGFDDPFSAMKDIAEYFRDLAADDRYFGAEPPTPDVQMLHAIAENASRKSVKAEMQGDAVHLRQASTHPTEEQTEARMPDEADDSATGDDTAVADVADLVSEPAVFVESDMPDLSDLAAGEVALWQQDAAAEMPAAESSEAPASPAAEVSQLFQMPSTDLPEPALNARSIADDSGLSATSIAAKLQRIRSVVAANVTTSPASAMPGFEDVETDDLTDEVPVRTSPAAQAIDQEDEEAGRAAPDPETVAGTDPSHAEEVDVAATVALPPAADEDDQSAPAAFRPEEDAVDVDDPEIASAPPETPDHADWVSEVQDDSHEDAIETAPAPVGDTEPDAWEEDAPDVLFPASRGLTEEDLEAAARLTRGRGAPRPEAFQLHVTASEGADFDDTETAPDEADAENIGADQDENVVSETPGDALVDRLLAQSEGALQEDGTQRRQNALSHLKAAVAATLADRLGSKRNTDSAPEPDNDHAFREDVAAIVATDAATDCESNIAPLVLRPQARVDSDPEASAVRPRRITRSALNAQDSTRAQDSGFAEYAETVGATELQDLLEAAAAYLSTVEGKTHFSRPEVMHMVMRHDRDRSFSREASLRSFGDLLRNGTIAKIDRGQFVISTNSQFVANG
ncbi:hypothetical protein PVW48_10060 [Dinoroseobacter sp. PD6]|nr:hypothetical protein [Dinoroseobacter sp. PD6]MDD9717090.1 hypothetical protein [Dinoroseobacter sp. PD6]